MASRLKVDVGRGMKEEVLVNPNTTMGDVLEQVCKRRKLNPEEHDLKHQRKLCDRALTVRFAGLSANAMLELVSAQRAAAQGECTIALQLEGGARLPPVKLHTATTLADVLAGHMPPSPSPAVPGAAWTVVYLGRPVSGPSLATTTLLSLGIAKGASALLRVSADASGGGGGGGGGEAAVASMAPPAAPPTATPTPCRRLALSPPRCPPRRCLLLRRGKAAVHRCRNPCPHPRRRRRRPRRRRSALLASPGEEMVEVARVEMVAEALSMLRASCEAAAAASGGGGGGGAGGGSFAASAALLEKYVGNILAAPGEAKYRAIKASNARFEQMIGRHAAGRQLLGLLGFSRTAGGAESTVEPVWTLADGADLAPLRLAYQLLTRVVEAAAAAEAPPPFPPPSEQLPQQPPPPAAPPSLPPQPPPSQPPVQPRAAAAGHDHGGAGREPAPPEGRREARPLAAA